MDRLVFKGEIKNGIRRHSEMTIPGRNIIRAAPADWPETLCRGSLNIRVTAYPYDFFHRCGGNDLIALDLGRFAPAFEISRDLITNNCLFPTELCPRGGDAQVWRALLTVDESQTTKRCWVLRRFASTLTEDLELVSEDNLRKVLGLVTGMRVGVDMEGAWRTGGGAYPP